MALMSDLRHMVGELSSASDRTAAIAAAAMLESAIDFRVKATIRKVGKGAVKQPEYEKILKSFTGRNGDIDSVTAKLHLLYLLGSIVEWAYLDLKVIYKMRNDFAHIHLVHDRDVPEPLTFKAQAISARCNSLTSPERFKDIIYKDKPVPVDLAKPRDRYLMAVMCFYGALIKDPADVAANPEPGN